MVVRSNATVAERDMAEYAEALHHDASAICFIAAQVNLAVCHEPRIVVRVESVP